MSRPRTPFGPQQPGRVPSTMLRVLAAELSDPGRLTRGKRLWSDRAVIEIDIAPGTVTAEVQGSRPLPYVVTIETDAGRRTPTREQLRVGCTCPDDEGTGRTACKHVVAALFALADEVAIEPDLVATWRRSDRVLDVVRDDSPDDERSESETENATDEHDRSARSAIEVGDDLGLLVRAAGGPHLPPLPEVAARSLPAIPDQLVRDVLDDALDHLRIRWE